MAEWRGRSYMYSCVHCAAAGSLGDCSHEAADAVCLFSSCYERCTTCAPEWQRWHFYSMATVARCNHNLTLQLPPLLHLLICSLRLAVPLCRDSASRRVTIHLLRLSLLDSCRHNLPIFSAWVQLKYAAEAWDCGSELAELKTIASYVALKPCFEGCHLRTGFASGP